MQTRPASPKDRSTLTRLIAPEKGNPFRPEEVACALELLEAVLNPPEGNTYEALVLADDHDRPLAWACFGPVPMTEATYDLYWLITDAEQRGRGLGGKLLADLEGLLRDRKARTLRIETSSLEGQGGARRFYERAGYTTVGLIQDFYRLGDDLVTLAKRLG